MASSGDYDYNTFMNRDNAGSDPNEERKLICPVCTKPAGSPLLICKNGHTICDRCFRKLRNCPVCDDGFTAALVYSGQIDCRYRPCPAICQVRDLKNHMEICEFRPITCPVCQTRSEIEFLQYPAHILNHRCSHMELPELYKVCFSVSWLGDGQINNKFWTPFPFRQGESDITFLLNMEIRATIFSVWIVAMLSEEQASCYYALMKIGDDLENNGTSQNYMKWTMNIGAIHKPGDEIRNSKEYAYCSPIQNVLNLLRISNDLPGLASLYVHFEVRKKENYLNLSFDRPLIDIPDYSSNPGHSGGGDVLNESRLNPLYEKLKEQEQEIVKLKAEVAEASESSKEQYKKIRLDLNMVEDRLNYRPCCNIQ